MVERTDLSCFCEEEVEEDIMQSLKIRVNDE